MFMEFASLRPGIIEFFNVVYILYDVNLLEVRRGHTERLYVDLVTLHDKENDA